MQRSNDPRGRHKRILTQRGRRADKGEVTHDFLARIRIGLTQVPTSVLVGVLILFYGVSSFGDLLTYALTMFPILQTVDILLGFHNEALLSFIPTLVELELLRRFIAHRHAARVQARIDPGTNEEE